jgi:hypothetical protein
VSPDLNVPVPTIGGQAHCLVLLPSDLALNGQLFWQQFLVFDPGANALGLTVSNTGEGRMGV